ncbi:hypothetical protein SAMN05216312_101117 [Cohnella sp. OV330]|uniref:hypothetical protein n=1 Tax=Cohnella sp. OV330 TaxID=1855288 RepID=UPI0008E4457E|nr:hypothetical protein [Cohnella sp. OV330]SFA72130.1 hypothetical protein SAMN05216312_101117 [Cohnella sp. OV330]
MKNDAPAHPSGSFKVVTLCGSTRFKPEFERINAELTLAGNVVISVGVFVHTEGPAVSEAQKQRLDLIHLQKIDMADEIFVVNPGGYIGESTRGEIEYATRTGVPVRYLVPPAPSGPDALTDGRLVP